MTEFNNTGYMNGVTDSETDTSAMQGCVTSPDEAHFLRDLFKMIVTDAVETGTSRETKVIDFKYPNELKKMMDLSLTDEGSTNEELLDICRDTIKYSVKSGHPHFFNQLFAGLDVYGVGGTYLTESMNTCGYTFEMAPVFSLIEREVIGTMSRLVGYEEHDGIFTPGGSMSNMFAISLARQKRFPEAKTDGLRELPRLCIFTSDASHYSIQKGAAFMGLGSSAVRPVPTDDKCRMIPAQLDAMITAAIQEGEVPLMVNATSGTTIAGAFDNLEDVAAVCERHNVWLHIDGAVGGSVSFSEKHKHLIKGADRSDSFTWDLHKMAGAPQQCAAFLTRHYGLLAESHKAGARYLFQQDKLYDVSYDSGDKTIQCGRKVDAFKSWLMLKAIGINGMGKRIENLFELARHMTNILRDRPDFRLVWQEPEGTNVSFWYIPPQLQTSEENEEWWKRIGKVAPLIKKRMTLKGSMMIGYNPMGDKVNFFRIVFANYRLSKDDVKFVVDEIVRLGSNISPSDL